MPNLELQASGTGRASRPGWPCRSLCSGCAIGHVEVHAVALAAGANQSSIRWRSLQNCSGQRVRRIAGDFVPVPKCHRRAWESVGANLTTSDSFRTCSALQLETPGCYAPHKLIPLVWLGDWSVTSLDVVFVGTRWGFGKSQCLASLLLQEFKSLTNDLRRRLKLN